MDSRTPSRSKSRAGRDSRSREYRISQGHDAAAALIVDGQLAAAAAEERFNRKKHSGDFPTGDFNTAWRQPASNPATSTRSPTALTTVRTKRFIPSTQPPAEQYEEVFSREVLLEQLDRELPGFPADRFYQVNHHLAHAASAYYTSGWEECLVVVMDGMGEAP